MLIYFWPREARVLFSTFIPTHLDSPSVRLCYHCYHCTLLGLRVPAKITTHLDSISLTRLIVQRSGPLEFVISVRFVSFRSLARTEDNHVAVLKRACRMQANWTDLRRSCPACHTVFQATGWCAAGTKSTGYGSVCSSCCWCLPWLRSPVS